jgi:hypothetical protein
VRQFWLFFGIQFMQFFLITINLRAAAQGLYAWTAFSDLLISANNFLLIKRISQSESRPALIGYSLGGALGSILAIYITKVLYGQ